MNLEAPHFYNFVYSLQVQLNLEVKLLDFENSTALLLCAAKNPDLDFFETPLFQIIYYSVEAEHRISLTSIQELRIENPALPELATKTIHIDEDTWLTKPDLMLARLRVHTGKARKIYARNTVLARIDKKMGMQFQMDNHLMVPLPGKFRYGLFHKGELVSIAVFSAGRNMKAKGPDYRSYELLRTCHKQGVVVVGGLSKLLRQFVAEHKPSDIMTYIDKDWSDGGGFRSLGFEEVGQVEGQRFWVDQQHYRRYSLFDLPPEWAETLKHHPQSLKHQGIYPKFNAGSLKLVKKIYY
jgi:hypothetical protein